MKRLALVVLLVFVGVSAVACRTVPLHTVAGERLNVPPNARVTLAEVSRAIRVAGEGLGWVMEDVRPGELTGTLRLRKHVAVVAIRHDTSTFGIAYRDSQNLLHQGDEIHRQYNNWVRNLARAIQTEVARLTVPR